MCYALCVMCYVLCVMCCPWCVWYYLFVEIVFGGKGGCG